MNWAGFIPPFLLSCEGVARFLLLAMIMPTEVELLQLYYNRMNIQLIKYLLLK